MSTSTNSDSPLPLRDAPIWFSRLYKDDEFEELYNTPIMIKLMPMNVRELMWRYSLELVGSERSQGGVTGQACRVIERFCLGLFKKYKELPLSEWQVRKAALKQKFKLYMGVSLMLASKMESAHNCITGNCLKRMLQRDGQSFNLSEIMEAELQVFSTIEYRLPMWSTVQKVNMFVLQLGFEYEIMQSAASFMEVVEHQMPVVSERIKRHAIDSSSPGTSHSEPAFPENLHAAGAVGVRGTQLVAGVVLATVRFTRAPGPDIAPTVAHWSRAPVSSVRWLGNVLHEFFVEHTAEVERKRLTPVDKPAEAKPKRRRLNF